VITYHPKRLANAGSWLLPSFAHRQLSAEEIAGTNKRWLKTQCRQELQAGNFMAPPTLAGSLTCFLSFLCNAEQRNKEKSHCVGCTGYASAALRSSIHLPTSLLGCEAAFAASTTCT
jgi:hypothetical protein